MLVEVVQIVSAAVPVLKKVLELVGVVAVGCEPGFLPNVHDKEVRRRHKVYSVGKNRKEQACEAQHR